MGGMPFGCGRECDACDESHLHSVYDSMNAIVNVLPQHRGVHDAAPHTNDGVYACIVHAFRNADGE